MVEFSCANGTARVTGWESKSSPGIFFKVPQTIGS